MNWSRKVRSAFFDVLTLYLPPKGENRRLKKPRSCILRDKSLLQLTEVSHVYRNWPITFLARSTGHRVTPTSFVWNLSQSGMPAVPACHSEVKSRQCWPRALLCHCSVLVLAMPGLSYVSVILTCPATIWTTFLLSVGSLASLGPRSRICCGTLPAVPDPYIKALRGIVFARVRLPLQLLQAYLTGKLRS